MANAKGFFDRQEDREDALRAFREVSRLQPNDNTVRAAKVIAASIVAGCALIAQALDK